MNNKVTHTAEKVKALAHSLQHISPYGYPTPTNVVRILNDLSRETLFQLAKELHNNTNYWEAIRTPKVYARG